MFRFIAALAGILGIIVLWSTGAFVMIAALLGDCSADGIRSSPLIGDVDRPPGCLSDTSRNAAFALSPLIAVGGSAVLAFFWLRLDRVLKRP